MKCARSEGGFPGGSVVKNLPADVGDTGLIPWPGKIPWRRKWQPIPIFLPGKSLRPRNVVGYSPWGHKSRTLATKEQQEEMKPFRSYRVHIRNRATRVTFFSHCGKNPVQSPR